MKKVTQFIPGHILEEAIDRVGAGMGQTGRWGHMSLSAAQQFLREAVAELLVLRSETTEWVCTRCKVVYPNPYQDPDQTPIATCSTCESVLRPHAVLKEAAYHAKIQELEDQKRRLEESLSVLLDLGINDS